MVDDDAEAERVRGLLTSRGAESVDAAREDWWIGVRDAEEAEYTRQGGDFGRTRRSTAWGSTRRSANPGPVPPFDEGRPAPSATDTGRSSRPWRFARATSAGGAAERRSRRRVAAVPRRMARRIAALLAFLVGGAG